MCGIGTMQASASSSCAHHLFFALCFLTQSVCSLAGSPPEGPATFVFEIGTEELPAADVSSAQEQVATAVPLLLAAARLDHGDIHVGATARRVSVVVQQLAPRQHAREDKIRGPPAT